MRKAEQKSGLLGPLNPRGGHNKVMRQFLYIISFLIWFEKKGKNESHLINHFATKE